MGWAGVVNLCAGSAAALQALGTDVVFLTNTMVLSLVAAGRPVTFQKKSKSGGGAVTVGTGDPQPPGAC